jgi:hypothetical protein
MRVNTVLLRLANVPEVMKTRLQLQGELMKTSDAPKVYANVFDVFKKTWRNEGIRGLQRGLVPAVRNTRLCYVYGCYLDRLELINVQFRYLQYAYQVSSIGSLLVSIHNLISPTLRSCSTDLVWVFMSLFDKS